MKQPRRARMPRPPKQRCPRCGGTHYAWSETTLCVDCIKVTQVDSDARVSLIRDARAARRQEQVDTLEPAREDYWGDAC